jgi:TPP-dependent pyruvate/acetoin dehydrogenase alpha subunit
VTVLEHGSAPSMTPEEELEAYRQMLLIRRFEEKAGQLYGMGQIGGFCHTSARRLWSPACSSHARRGIR